jgi:hypothetical protein
MRAYGTVRQSAHLSRVYCVVCADSRCIHGRAVQRHQDSGACAGTAQSASGAVLNRGSVFAPLSVNNRRVDKASVYLQTWSSPCRILRLHCVSNTSVHLAACQKAFTIHICVLMLRCCCAVLCAGPSCAAVGCSSAVGGPQWAGGCTTQLCGTGGDTLLVGLTL